MINPKDSDLYKRFHEISSHTSANEKLYSLRSEMIRCLSIIDGYTELLQTLDLDGSAENLTEFGKFTGKIAQASFELKAILFGLTD